MASQGRGRHQVELTTIDVSDMRWDVEVWGGELGGMRIEMEDQVVYLYKYDTILVCHTILNPVYRIRSQGRVGSTRVQGSR